MLKMGQRKLSKYMKHTCNCVPLTFEFQNKVTASTKTKNGVKHMQNLSTQMMDFHIKICIDKTYELTTDHTITVPYNDTMKS